MKNIDEIINNQVNLVWQEQILDRNPFALSNQKNPQGFVLGRQPGIG